MCQVYTWRTSHTRAWKKRLYRLPPNKDYHEYITRTIYRYAYARQTQVNWKKETKNKYEEKGKERKEKKAKKKTKKEKEKKRQEKQEKATGIYIRVRVYRLRMYELCTRSGTKVYKN